MAKKKKYNPLYINRAGKNLPSERKKVLNQAKEELRKLFGRE